MNTTNTDTTWNRAQWYSQTYGWRCVIESTINNAHAQLNIDYQHNTRRMSSIGVSVNGTVVGFFPINGNARSTIQRAKECAYRYASTLVAIGGGN
jgi:hypothetical protein